MYQLESVNALPMQCSATRMNKVKFQVEYNGLILTPPNIQTQLINVMGHCAQNTRKTIEGSIVNTVIIGKRAYMIASRGGESSTSLLY